MAARPVFSTYHEKRLVSLTETQPGANEVPCESEEEGGKGDEDAEGERERGVGDAEEAVAEAVHHVKDGVKLRERAPDARQSLY